MNVADAYGDFELPDEKSEIEVIEDPVKTIISCFKLFEKKTKTDEYKYFNDATEMEEKLYQEAVKIFDGKEDLKASAKELEEISRAGYASAYEIQAVLPCFFSAMQNTTHINDLVISPPANRFLVGTYGYLLKENKCLFLTTGVYHSIGFKNRGNIITTKYCEGICIGEEHESGLIINFGKPTFHMGEKQKGGIIIQIGDANTNAISSHRMEGGIFINSTGSDSIGRENSGGLIININKKDVPLYRTVIDLPRYAKFSHIQKKLEDKLEETKCLKDLENPVYSYGERINRLNKFNFKQFQIDITAIAEEIKEKYEEMIR